ncbi:flagellar basal body rod protein FlgC [Endozoicomonas ascidiicola]|uniref:flagellar basal body rod protein FlgC n=1 Tax=Endozoicomonas ascidiicola TaxID=1698521 RepID=UPI0008348699|nr:flagellar basal body rod protein FlgC [Endozoicomonas ascidiicola]
MSLSNIFAVSGSALNAQTVRLNSIASNLANMSSVGSSPETAYRPLRPVFSTIYDDLEGQSARVNIEGVYKMPPSDNNRRYEPGNPLADETGYVYYPDINVIQEMADMLSATRSYQSSMEVMVSARKLQQTLLSLAE